ncbi:glycosyltransferase family 1 protein [Zasmidium cellare ATCC 36951]|uniref:Glycosyltransferase family 1 protein n=1 Tax=Zasmidium cellare ATCC 36951 TaxID=1080233 RepID=A0A6A6BYX0_ZASCE|nr:glycosyltransferase family 1 protein [Zasmidium cellare ATCC 36951]KAF2159994.1 glycosyltransferase family 1 protein [Zasmidium cellare ATCC 36951]
MVVAPRPRTFAQAKAAGCHRRPGPVPAEGDRRVNVRGRRRQEAGADSPTAAAASAPEPPHVLPPPAKKPKTTVLAVAAGRQYGRVSVFIKRTMMEKPGLSSSTTRHNAYRAIDEAHGMTMLGRTLRVQRSQARREIAILRTDGLQANYHELLIATHAEFKPWVEKHGIESAEVAGDPAELMRICVENGMFTPSFIFEANSTYHSWIDILCQTRWAA